MLSEYISSVRNAGVNGASTHPTHCDCKSRLERELSCSWRRLAVRSSRWNRTRHENRREIWRHGKHLQLRRTATSHGMCDVTIKGFEGEALERELTVRSGCHECFLISSSAILTEYCNKCEYNHNTHHLQSPYTRVCLLTRQKTNALASKTHKGNFTWQKNGISKRDRALSLNSKYLAPVAQQPSTQHNHAVRWAFDLSNTK